MIDVVKDQLYGADYVEEEDPRKYVSQKTNRGPLGDNWIAEYSELCKVCGCIFLLIFKGESLEKYLDMCKIVMCVCAFYLRITKANTHSYQRYALAAFPL